MTLILTLLFKGLTLKKKYFIYPSGLYSVSLLNNGQLLLCGLSIVNNGHCYYAVCLLGTMAKCLYFRSIHGEQWTNVIIRSVYCVRYNGQCYHALFLLGTTESLLRTVHTLYRDLKAF